MNGDPAVARADRVAPGTPTQGTWPEGRPRLRLRDPDSPFSRLDGVWWPRSRVLQTEAAELLAHLTVDRGTVERLLFSRPDWDDGVVQGRGTVCVQTDHGPVEAGSFPSDDTHEMVLVLDTGERLRLTLVPSGASAHEAQRAFAAVDDAHEDPPFARWDDERPTGPGGAG